MFTTLFYIIIAIVILDFAFERYLSYLNSTMWSNTLPEAFKGIYDEEKYRKSQDYFKDNQKFGHLTSSFSLVLILGMLFFAGFAFVDSWAGQYTSNAILIALLFFGVLGLGMDILTTPFSLYDTFVIEERYGFNKTTLKLFFTDKLKGWLLGAIIGGGILALIIWFYLSTGKYFWLFCLGIRDNIYDFHDHVLFHTHCPHLQ